MGHRPGTQSYSADAVIDSVRADVGFEVGEVASVGIRDEKIAITGLDRETQVDRANLREVTVYGEGGGVDFNNVVVGHGVLNDVCPGGRIIRVACIYDEAYLRWRREVRIRGRRLRWRLANRYEGCVISGKGESGIQLCAVCVYGHCARVLAKQGDICDQGMRDKIEDRDLILASGADEGFARCEDDIGRFVFDIERIYNDALGD